MENYLKKQLSIKQTNAHCHAELVSASIQCSMFNRSRNEFGMTILVGSINFKLIFNFPFSIFH